MSLMASYYTQENNELELKQMICLLQREAARVEAQSVQKKVKAIKREFKGDGKRIASDTKEAIRILEEHFDTAIKGEVRKAIEKKVAETLPEYEKVFK